MLETVSEIAQNCSAKKLLIPGGHFKKQVKNRIPKNLQKGIPFTIRSGHTIRLEVTHEPLTVHTGRILFYATAETLDIPWILNTQVKVKERESAIRSRSIFWPFRPMRLSEEIIWTIILLHMNAFKAKPDFKRSAC